MGKVLSFPEQIFSEKEIRDFKRRAKVAKLLGVGERWKKIKEETGAHLQTIAIVSKRLKSRTATPKTHSRSRAGKPIFTFGKSVE